MKKRQRTGAVQKLSPSGNRCRHDEGLSVFAGEERVRLGVIKEPLFSRIQSKQRPEPQLGFCKIHIVFSEVLAGALKSFKHVIMGFELLQTFADLFSRRSITQPP